AAMLDRTISEVSRLAPDLPVGDVLARSPLRRAVLAATVLLAFIAAFAGLNSEAMARWQRAWIGLADEYWDRKTTLEARVLVRPGDRIRDFRDSSGQSTGGRPGEYRHPRGGDLTLLIEVPETRRPDGTEWVIPERVQVSFQDASGSSGTSQVTRTGDRQFLFTRAGLLEDMELWIRGNDFVTRESYRIRVVDPPQIDRIVMQCTFPEYTGWNEIPERDTQVVQGTQISLPMETQFVMQATASKPLVGVRVEFGRYVLEASRRDGKTSGTLLRTALESGADPERITIPADVAATFLETDGRGIRVPFILRQLDPEESVQAGEPLPDPSQPFELPSDSRIRIYLEDEDDIFSADATRVAVSGIPDLEPIVEAEFRGIGEAITRKAVIPVHGVIRDDYGVVKARFEFRVDDEEEWRPRPFRQPPAEATREFRFRRDAQQEYETFEVLPLDLNVGQKLTLTVYAEDGDDRNGPHISRSKPVPAYTFRIVTNEELLSLLYGRELNLRRRFERIIEEVTETRDDVVTHRERAEELLKLRENSTAENATERARLQTAITVSAERASHQVLKNASELRAIEQAFRDILEELVNNAVHTRQMVDRIDSLIVEPMKQINDDEFPAADQAIGLFRLRSEQGNNPVQPMGQAIESLDRILERMNAILSEMKDLVEFHEALQDLENIIQQEEELSEETRKVRNQDLIRKLKLLD
ncbi:MAG: hypothetical protein KDA79_21430, partial [Planctomycetaceae bacterium]|nr:hypothetical protein [Planctomycetaceae bacterium]